jgi:hypothetical protein
MCSSAVSVSSLVRLLSGLASSRLMMWVFSHAPPGWRLHAGVTPAVLFHGFAHSPRERENARTFTLDLVQPSCQPLRRPRDDRPSMAIRTIRSSAGNSLSTFSAGRMRHSLVRLALMPLHRDDGSSCVPTIRPPLVSTAQKMARAAASRFSACSGTVCCQRVSHPSKEPEPHRSES